MKNDLTLVLAQMERDEKLDARVPSVLKATLKKEAREKRYRSLSEYVLAILLRRGGEVKDLVVLVAIALTANLGFLALARNRRAAECPQRLVSVILKCDVSGCDVRVADGTLGRAKLPVELGKLQEVCPL